MPDVGVLRPVFKNVQGRKKQDEEMKEDGDSVLSEDQIQINSEIEHIMDALSQKGDVEDSLKKLLSDKSKIKT